MVGADPAAGGGPHATSSTASGGLSHHTATASPAAYVPHALMAEAVEAGDLSHIPEATVVCAPPGQPHSESSSTAAAAASIPNAAMAYTVSRRLPGASTNGLPPQFVDPRQQRAAQGRRVIPQGLQAVIFIGDNADADFVLQGRPPPQEPPDHLPLAVFSCLCCWCLSIAAIWESRMVHVLYRRGDFAGAYEASSRARVFALMGIVVGGLLTLLAIFSYRKGG